MKSIIDGKIYDTETAELLAEASSNCGRSDFRFWNEDLYRTKLGQFFICGEGGPMSHWSEPACGGGMQGGSGINLVTEKQVRDWAERWLDTEKYLTIFPAEQG